MNSTATLSNSLRLSTDVAAAVSTAPHKEVLDNPNSLSTHRATADSLTTIFENFLGQLFPSQGLLLLNKTGQVLQSNVKAREFCHILQDHSIEQGQELDLETMLLPDQIAALCAFLVDARLEFPECISQLQLSEDIFLDNGLRMSLNAEWIALEEPSILVRIEDMTQSAGRRALGDACRYNLTPRETEVWALFLQGLSYQDISDQLFVTMSTVKKHMKNVYSKRRDKLL